MGVAKILSHSGEGLYAIELQYRTQLILKKRDDLAKEIKELNEDFEEYQENLTELQEELEYTEITLNTLINSPLFPLTGSDIAAGITTKEEKRENDLKQLTRKITSLEREIIFVEEQINLNEIRFETADKERILYEEHSDDPILLEAWCIEYNVDLKADDFVETIEINDEYNEPNTKINIRPVTAKTIPELQNKVELEGRLFKTVLEESIPQVEHPLNSEKWTIAWNWMTLPAMQRWRPLYRIGRITAINIATQKCNLTYNEQEYYSSVLPFPNFLDAVDFAGGEGKYSIELKIAEENVPVVYMDCNIEPFKVDDIVVVEYQKRDFLKPQVIGFHENPKRCEIRLLAYIEKGSGNLLASEIGLFGTLSGSPFDLLDSEETIMTDNFTSGRRLNYGQKTIGEKITPEFTNIYTFHKFKLFRNGIEVELPFVINGYLVNIGNQGEPVNIVETANYIIGVEVYDDHVYLLTDTPQLTDYNNQETGGDYGFRIFVLTEPDLFLVDTYEISSTIAITAELTTPPQTGNPGPIKHYYYNNQDLVADYYYQLDVLQVFPVGPDGGELILLHAGSGLQDGKKITISRIFGFSINEDNILISFTRRHVNLLEPNPTRSTNVMLIDRFNGQLMSHVFTHVAPSEELGLLGFASARELETDHINYDPINDPDNENIDGKVKIQGMSEGEELETDAFASIGEVT